MASGIGWMLDKIERRLVLMHVVVFAAVLSVLAVCVLVYFQYSLQEQVKSELSRLADSVISSIDYYDESGHTVEGKPDSIASVLPDDAARSLNAMKLQWFDRSGQLSADKGHLSIRLPFAPQAGFQEQKDPHALLLTRAAIVRGKLLGYVRVAHPMINEDQAFVRLLIAIVVGVTGSLLATAFGISWLVRQSMAPIVEMMGLLKQFTVDASHELRNPLMVIRTNADVALKYQEGMRPSDKEKFLTIQSAANQMTRMSEELLNLSQSEGDIALDKHESIDVADICQRIGMHWATTTEGVDVETAFPDNFWVVGRHIDFERVFDNLIANAFQYSRPGGKVTIEGRMLTNSIEISVSDGGIGIEPTDLPKVFDRFWRADKARSVRESGSGLGLSICKALVESYGGTISVESKPNAGSKFTVRLPSMPRPQSAEFSLQIPG